MVLGKLTVPGRPTILIKVGQGPTALAVGAGGGCLDIFTLIYPLSPLSPSLWETARYRLKYCLKGPLNPKQPASEGNFQSQGVLLIWIKVGQGPVALALIYYFYLLYPSLWEMARYRLKYCLKRPLNPNQPTNQHPRVEDSITRLFLLQPIGGGAMVLGNHPVPGRPTILITVGQGPIAHAVGAGWGGLDIFILIYPFSPLSPSLWETARYRLIYCLKGPLNPKQPTNQLQPIRLYY